MKRRLVVAAVCALASLTGSAFAGSLAATRFLPERRSDDICVDTPLRVTFDRPPLIGVAGTIRVYRSDDVLVDSIDLADPGSARRPIGGAMAGGSPYLFNYYPVITAGHTAAIYLHRVLEYGETYYVLIDRGVFNGVDARPFRGIRRPQTWRFTTRASGPSPEATRLVVDANGEGDFCTVQGAIDFVPTDNPQRVVVEVRKGTYTEIVYVNSRKPFITVRGESRNRSIIQYANNNNFNGRVSGLFRAMFGVDASDFVLENITLHNTTPYLGSQAEAFRGYGARTLLNRVNLRSFQDTLLLQNRGFVTSSYIEGDVDFTWGGGPVFFENTELRALHAGYYAQIRNAQSARGNVYVNCALTRASTLANESVYLGRIDPGVFPFSEVMFINSAMDAHVRSAGWLLNNADCSQASHIAFGEYHSADLNGDLLDVSERLACSTQLSDEQADQFRDPAFVLGGWVPIAVNVDLDAVAPGGLTQVHWSAPPSHSDADSVGLFRRGAPDSDYVAAQETGTDRTTGDLAFAAPFEPGRYELRYFVADEPASAATSSRIRVR